MAGITFAPREQNLMDFKIDPRLMLEGIDKQAISPLMNVQPTPQDIQAYYANQIQGLMQSDALDSEMKAKIGQLNINTVAPDAVKQPLLPNDPPKIDSYKESIPDTTYATPTMTTPPAPEFMKTKPITSQGDGTVELFRGENTSSGNKGYKKGYYSLDKGFATQFTQRGMASEVKSRKIDSQSIYDATKHGKELPSANNEKSFDEGMAEAKRLGFKAFMLSEGKGQPNSVYVF